MIIASRTSSIEVIKVSISCSMASVILSPIHEEFQEDITSPNKVSVMVYTKTLHLVPQLLAHIYKFFHIIDPGISKFASLRHN